MKLTPEQINDLLKTVSRTRDDEINCEECLDLVSAFAELELAGKPIPAALEAVQQHLSVCPDCHEEYQALRRALDNLNEGPESP